jgi:hypothetical protein
MENWQFLIQKQGDRSWHLLESPKLEILEGRYRIVARSHLCNTDVEVRIAHLSTDAQAPPKRRVYKRSRRTNAEGLMAVIPFTYLHPGLWDLQCCCGDLMSELLGQSWQYTIQLKVLAQKQQKEIETPTTSSKSTQSNSSFFLLGDTSQTGLVSVLLPNSPEDAIIDRPVSPVWLKKQTAQQILDNLIELALPFSEPILEDKTATEPLLAVSELPLLVTLEKQIYTIGWGQILTINGCIQRKQKTHPTRIYAGEIRIELRSPQALEIIAQVLQPLGERLLPFSLQHSIEIPADCQSKLILGDISFYGTLAPKTEATLLANQYFLITADITELLAVSTAIKNSKQDRLQTKTLAAPNNQKPSAKLDLELFNIVKTRKITQPLQTQPRPKISLPPRLQPPSSHSCKAFRSLQLPKLPQKTAGIIETATQLRTLEKKDTLFPTGYKRQTDTAFPCLKRLKVLPYKHSGHNHDLCAVEESQPNHATAVHDEVKLADNCFTDSVALAISPSSRLSTLQNPYISPLIVKWMHSHGYSLSEAIDVEYEDYDNCIADLEETSQQQQENASVLPLPPPPPPVSSFLHQSQPLCSSGSLNLTQEIVVDDICDEDNALLCYEQKQKQSKEDVQTIVLGSTAAIEPLPIPQLHLPDGELISGTSVRVRVQLPCLRPGIAVKLWVEDCQMRWLLDGPRLLTNLLPNRFGGSEVITSIHIPFGCLEIRLEAVSVDTASKQESHKITVVRTVVPQTLLLCQLDEVLGL